MKRVSLIVNLGSPDSTDPKDVKTYLGEFLMDERVIDLPDWARKLLVKGIILNTRPKKSAEAYSKIWWDEGSPLIVLSHRLMEKVRQETDMPLYLGMRYGNPSIADALKVIVEEHPDVEDILVLPMYPQYAMSSYETVVEKVRAEAEKIVPTARLMVKPAFYQDDDYIDVLADSFRPYLDKGFDKLLLSYHGVPERHIKKGDITGKHCLKGGDCCRAHSAAHEFCYRHQCVRTSDLVRAALGLEEGQVAVSFQSRLGFDPWIRPYTDKTLKELGKQGVGTLAVACPAFVTDCLETLEEIQMEGAETFEENGGHHFTMIPCLNDSDEWAQLIGRWINDPGRWIPLADSLRPDYVTAI
jgi:ferrochelatase